MNRIWMSEREMKTEVNEKEWDTVGEMFLVGQLSKFSVSNDKSDIAKSETREEILENWRQQHIADAIRRHEVERRDATFSKICLLCRECILGTRSQVMLHFEEAHNFYIGSNEIVFVDEYLDHIDYKLINSECFFCEKHYDNWVVLREHMELKKHWRLNPENPTYYKYFLSNYTEPNKIYRDFNKTHPQEYQPSPEDLTELTEDEKVDTFCLYCDKSSKQVEEILQHMEVVHYFNLHQINQLPLYFKDKKNIVHFIRQQVFLKRCPVCNQLFPGPLQLSQHLALSQHSTLLPSYELFRDIPFFPSIQMDKLIYSLEDFYIHHWR